MDGPRNEEFFDKIYSLLVTKLDAPEGMRQSFIRNHADDHAKAVRHQSTEWRFCGLLGFGGKLWVTPEKIYVSCYREDETHERRKAMEDVNRDLLGLFVDADYTC